MYFLVVEIDTRYCICEFNKIKLRTERCNLPAEIEVGDRFYHIEHRRYDIYNTNNKMKYGLVHIPSTFWTKL